MKILNKFRTPFFTFLLLVISVLFFQNCNPEEIEEEDETPCDTCAMVYKPNIYIYPTQTIQLNVTLSFPLGGEIVTSIPEYGLGWNVNVNKDGWINDKYNYLFYESMQPDVWQMESGWIVPQTNLKSFFSGNMESFGFRGREIEDFTDYWIPKLNAENYAIYPQTKPLINSVIEIDFSENPDNLLRLFYVIEEVNSEDIPELSDFEMSTPFKREGFFVSEWGVILK